MIKSKLLLVTLCLACQIPALANQRNYETTQESPIEIAVKENKAPQQPKEISYASRRQHGNFKLLPLKEKPDVFEVAFFTIVLGMLACFFYKEPVHTITAIGDVMLTQAGLLPRRF